MLKTEMNSKRYFLSHQRRLQRKELHKLYEEQAILTQKCITELIKINEVLQGEIVELKRSDRMAQKQAKEEYSNRCSLTAESEIDKFLAQLLVVITEQLHVSRCAVQCELEIQEKMIANKPTTENEKLEKPPSGLLKLTTREQEVLRMIATGVKNREIAQTLCISEGTVRNHVSNILNQLNVRDRTQAAIIANTFGYGSFRKTEMKSNNHCSS